MNSSHKAKKKYIQYPRGDVFYSVHSSVMNVLSGDQIGAAFLNILFFRLNGVIKNKFGDEPPDFWPEDLWVKQSLGGISSNWLIGTASPNSLRLRIKWLESEGLVKTRQSSRHSSIEYKLEVNRLNGLLSSGSIIRSFQSFMEESQERNFEQPIAQNCTTGERKIEHQSDPYIVLGINEVNKEELNESLGNQNPVLESTEKTELPEADPPFVSSAGSVDDLYLDDPIEEFVRNQIRIKTGFRFNPRTREGQRTVEELHRGEEKHGAAEYRSAFLLWLDPSDEYLKQRKFNPSNFTRNEGRYLQRVDRIAPRAEAPVATGSIPGRQTMVADTAPSPARPGASEYVSTWNRIVTLRPFQYQPPSTSEFYQDSGMTMELWEKACVSSQAIIQERGPRVSWLLLEWMLETKPKKRINWRRMADGEYDHMAVPEGGGNNNRGSGVADRVLAKYQAMEDKEKADKLKAGKPTKKAEDEEDDV
jgi:hypothetical protein